MKIKVLEKTEGCMPEIYEEGDCIDLCTAEEYTFKCPHAKMLHKKKSNEEVNIERFRDVVFTYGLINLGVVIEMPKGYKGILKPKSSTFKKFGLIQTNTPGEIDSSYKGPDDIWKLPVLATRTITIPKGTPIAQFEIVLSQKATIWQKLKWLFSNGIKLQRIDSVSNANRGGFGTVTEKKIKEKQSE